MSGLNSGTTYSFLVEAVGAFGDGGTATSNSITAGDVPGIPGAVHASAQGRRATITWTAAASNGSAITGYTVTSRPVGLTTTTTPTASSTFFDKVATGTAYTFKVQTTNGFGAGVVATSNSVTPSCTSHTTTLNPLGANDSITVQYGTADMGDLGGTGTLDAAYNSSLGLDMTGWVRFSFGPASTPAWAVVTDLKLGVVIQAGNSAGPPHILVQYSANDDWSRTTNPKAADLPRTLASGVAGPLTLPTPGTQMAQMFTLLDADRYTADVEEPGQYVTFGVANDPATSEGGAEAVFFGADAGALAPFLIATTCY